MAAPEQARCARRCLGLDRRCKPANPVSTTLENEAVATVENEATHTDWMGDLCGGWALIRQLVADGVPQRQVARDLDIGRSTVARAVASDGPPKYERPAVPTSFMPFESAVPTSFMPFESAVRQLLVTTPDMPATVIAEPVCWTGSISWFREHVRQLRPETRRWTRRTG
jgi:hypothetical protein